MKANRPDGAAVADSAPRVLEGVDEPVFREPWEAHAFAMTVSLHRAGLFTWREWADTLARRIVEAQAAGDADLGDTYYRHWLAALERLLADARLVAPEETRARGVAIDSAQRSDHGQLHDHHHS